MYTSIHTAVGALLVCSSQAISTALGFPLEACIAGTSVLAVASHHLLDILKEMRFTKIWAVVLFEVLLHVLMFWSMWDNRLFFLFLAGGLLGNFQDLIDKPYYLLSGGKVFFRCHRPGWEKVILSRWGTIASSLVATAGMFAFSLWGFR